MIALVVAVIALAFSGGHHAKPYNPGDTIAPDFSNIPSAAGGHYWSGPSNYQGQTRVREVYQVGGIHYYEITRPDGSIEHVRIDASH